MNRYNKEHILKVWSEMTKRRPDLQKILTHRESQDAIYEDEEYRLLFQFITEIIPESNTISNNFILIGLRHMADKGLGKDTYKLDI